MGVAMESVNRMDINLYNGSTERWTLVKRNSMKKQSQRRWHRDVRGQRKHSSNAKTTAYTVPNLLEDY